MRRGSEPVTQVRFQGGTRPCVPRQDSRGRTPAAGLPRQDSRGRSPENGEFGPSSTPHFPAPPGTRLADGRRALSGPPPAKAGSAPSRASPPGIERSPGNRREPPGTAGTAPRGPPPRGPPRPPEARRIRPTLSPAESVGLVGKCGPGQGRGGPSPARGSLSRGSLSRGAVERSLDGAATKKSSSPPLALLISCRALSVQLTLQLYNSIQRYLQYSMPSTDYTVRIFPAQNDTFLQRRKSLRIR